MIKMTDQALCLLSLRSLEVSRDSKRSEAVQTQGKRVCSNSSPLYRSSFNSDIRSHTIWDHLHKGRFGRPEKELVRYLLAFGVMLASRCVVNFSESRKVKVLHILKQSDSFCFCCFVLLSREYTWLRSNRSSRLGGNNNARRATEGVK